MRQNTRRMARGTLRRGSSDSPAATPTSSVPWNEYATAMATPPMVAKLPTNGASPTVQLANPGMCPVWTMPARIATPVTKKQITATTLISENQYSLSPKPRAENALSPSINNRNSPLQRIPGTSGNQYAMTSCAATRSTATTTAQLNQKFQPSAKPKPLST